jgi:ABC-type arginine/histidine transport system permease subunit
MPHYYDLILGFIPLALGGIPISLSMVGVSLTLGVPLAAAVSIALIGHGMFARPPGASSAPQPESQPFNFAD